MMKKIIAIALALMMIGTISVFAVGTEGVTQGFDRVMNGFGFGGQNRIEGGMLQNTNLTQDENIDFQTERLQDLVISGRITQEEADERLEQMKENIANGNYDDSERLLMQQNFLEDADFGTMQGNSGGGCW